MARRPTQTRSRAGAPPPNVVPADVGTLPIAMPTPPGPTVRGGTGRFLILLDPDDIGGATQAMVRSAGLRMEGSGGSDGVVAMADEHLGENQGLVFHDLGVAVVHAAPDQVAAVSSAVASSRSLHLMEPERYVFASAGFDLSYFRGYRDAVNHLYDQVAGGDGAASISTAAADDPQLAWGLQATNVANSQFSGRDIKVAVLDTGLDLNHPDFAGRKITTQSFVSGQTVQDGFGHGTHCCGVACGPRRPQRLPRYGIAHEAELFVGKVLNDAGRGTDANILAGIQWALGNGCDVISMSLGAPVTVGQSFSAIFQQVAERAFARGSIIVAAAGNDSDRKRGVVRPVSHPANCPGMFAVAAVDRALQPADFSNGSVDTTGGKIDIAGPGVDVMSSWPAPVLYKSEDGTSMATPHVAGIAALFAQANPTSRGRDLWARLLQPTRSLQSDSRDVGAGLVQAP